MLRTSAWLASSRMVRTAGKWGDTSKARTPALLILLKRKSISVRLARVGAVASASAPASPMLLPRS
jgi:hypothetical protein